MFLCFCTFFDNKDTLDYWLCGLYSKQVDFFVVSVQWAFGVGATKKMIEKIFREFFKIFKFFLVHFLC